MLDHLNLITRSGHSCFRQVSLLILYIYMTINFIFSLLLVGSLYASFSVLIRSYFTDENCSTFGAAKGFETFYLGILFVFTLMSITKPIEKSATAYTFMVLLFGVFVFISLGFGLKYFWEQQRDQYVGYLLAVTMLGGYIVPYVLNCPRINI